MFVPSFFLTFLLDVAEMGGSYEEYVVFNPVKLRRFWSLQPLGFPQQ